MVESFEDIRNQFLDDEAISDSGNSFPGRAVSINGKTGDTSLISPGIDMDLARQQQAEGKQPEGMEEFTSVKFVPNALLYFLEIGYGVGANGSGEQRYRTSKRDARHVDGQGYVANIDGKYIAGTNKKSFIADARKKGVYLDESKVKEVAMYYGFMTSLNGHSLDKAELISFKSKGIQRKKFSDELRKAGIQALRMSDIVEVIKSTDTVKTASGEYYHVFDYKFANIMKMPNTDKLIDQLTELIGVDNMNALQNYIKAEHKNSISLMRDAYDGLVPEEVTVKEDEVMPDPFADDAQVEEKVETEEVSSEPQAETPAQPKPEPAKESPSNIIDDDDLPF